MSSNQKNSFLIRDFRFTYGDGLLKVEGVADENPHTFECTLDSEGRITHIDQTSILNDSTTLLHRSDFTYDAEGRLLKTYEITDDDGGGLTQDYIWEGEDIRSISTTNGSVVLDFETSDAPAQAMFELLSYDTGLSELCAQGCFGTLPAHMPSKRTMTTTLLPGMPPFVSTYHYNYTLNADGRLATVEATNESDNKTTTHTLIWEDR